MGIQSSAYVQQGRSTPSLCWALSLRFNGHFPGGPRLAGTRMSPFWILLILMMMEVVVTTGVLRRAVKSSPPTNQHSVFYRSDALPVAQPCQNTEGNLRYHGKIFTGTQEQVRPDGLPATTDDLYGFGYQKHQNQAHWAQVHHLNLCSFNVDNVCFVCLFIYSFIGQMQFPLPANRISHSSATSLALNVIVQI